MITVDAILNTKPIRFEKPTLQRVYPRMTNNNVLNTVGFSNSVLNPSFTFYGNDTTCVFLFNSKQKEENNIDNIYTDAFNLVHTSKWVETISIKSQILTLQNKGNTEKTLDYIFDKFDDLLIEKQYDLINNFLESIDVKDLNINNIVGILTITSNSKNELISRSLFYQQAYKYINDIYLSTVTNQILGGLE